MPATPTSSYIVEPGALAKALRSRRRLGQNLIMEGADTSPVEHWTQGAARIAKALMGGMELRRADQEESDAAAAKQAEKRAKTVAAEAQRQAEKARETQVLFNLPGVGGAIPPMGALGRPPSTATQQPAQQAQARMAQAGALLTPHEQQAIRALAQTDRTAAIKIWQNAMARANERQHAQFKEVDAGDRIMLVNPYTGQVVREIEKGAVQPSGRQKDIAAEAEQRAVGKSRGEDRALHESMTSKMPALEKMVTELDKLGKKATYTLLGRGVDYGMKQVGLDPREAAKARAEYVSKVSNQILPLLRDTFGAQFTQKEGETLRATLGDADMHPKEKNAVLRAFIQQKRRTIAGLAGRLGEEEYTPPAGALGAGGESGASSLKDKYGLE